MSMSEMDAPELRLSSRGCARCALLGVIWLMIAVVCQTVYRQIEPYWRVATPIEVTVLNSNGQPVIDARVVYEDHTIIPWIWLLPFGPARTIHEEHAAATDSAGVARFSIRFEGYLQQVRVGDSRALVHHATTTTWNGQAYTLKSLEGAGIAQWFRAPAADAIQRTTVYLAPVDRKKQSSD
ncbi:MAG: hypothetical protein JWO94_2947 [Verrucomicrobiaceae bacterium]|nr:hypothetical protein [Verrucomicrobiaceae bacterium]